MPPYDSTVAERLRKHGAIILGKTNMDEFSMGHYGPVVNPWGTPFLPFSAPSTTKYVAGGSSGGSAVAVAAGACPLAVGGDTGGSVRLPASYCGIVGFKPSYGRWGLIAYASSLDTPGVFARTVSDAALLFDALGGYEPRDSTSLPLSPPKTSEALNQDLSGMKVGIPKEYFVKELSQEIVDIWEKGIDTLRRAGAEIVSVSLPHTAYALPAYYILATAEASSNLSRYDGVRYGLREEGSSIEEIYFNTRSKGFGKEVQRRILLGTFVLSRKLYESYYRKAQQVRRLVKNDFDEVFSKGIGLLLTPTAPTDAFPLDEKLDPITEYMNDVMTIPASLAGLPAISVPAGLSQRKLPLGLQLIGPWLGEQAVLNGALALENAAEIWWK